uniref:Uncharacterized protein n=1 Tax=Ananas comosus var. bracteatus TaxID=296719 RepID=A0A6V7NYL2_ANACO|nr:unnamed protein product [Ananas comosus var. bracteatus]
MGAVWPIQERERMAIGWTTWRPDKAEATRRKLLASPARSRLPSRDHARERALLSPRSAEPDAGAGAADDDHGGGGGGGDKSKTRKPPSLVARISAYARVPVTTAAAGRGLLLLLLLLAGAGAGAALVVLLVRSRPVACVPLYDPLARAALFSGSRDALASDFGILGVPWCRSKHGKTVEWTTKDLLNGLEEFVLIYENRPIRNNKEKLCRFGTVDWRKVMKQHGISDLSRVLVFFDDHQNELKRSQQALRAGFQNLVFEDNYDTGTGDIYTLRQICDQSYIRGGGHSCFRDSDEARIRSRRKMFWDKAVDIDELCGKGDAWWGVRGYMRDDFNHSNKAISYAEHFQNSRFLESVLDVYWELPPVAGPRLLTKPDTTLPVHPIRSLKMVGTVYSESLD